MPSKYQRYTPITSLHSSVQAQCFTLVSGFTVIHPLNCRMGAYFLHIDRHVGAVELFAQSMLSDIIAGAAVSALVCELAAAKGHGSADAGRHLLVR